MPGRPDVVDNLDDGVEHAAALRYLMQDTPSRFALAVATGYVNLAGLRTLADLANGRPTRLLIGAEPGPLLAADTASALPLFETHRERLRDERDLSRFPPSRAARDLAEVHAWLDRPEVQVRRYTQRFLHGKAYLFGSAQDARVALVTSANLTAGGLHHNLELGIAHYEPGVCARALGWFDALWDVALDYEDALRELLFPDAALLDPHTIYLRALHELAEPPLDVEQRPSRPALELAPFQRDGYERARAISRRHGGVIYADGVGTGKTEIGLAFIEERTKEDGVYALVIAPAQLARRWNERIVQAKLPAQVISFNELAADEQLAPEARNRRRVLSNLKDAYRLVVIDEAHALRNVDTSWYRATERLLGGTDKQVVLLTATPINNGLWDLYNLVLLFARHDRAFASIGIDSVRDLFLAAGAGERDPDALSPDVLFPLADAVSVRRDRRFIETEYSGQQFPDGTPVRFPKPHLRTVRYDLDAAHPGMLDRIASAIDALSMARYRPSAYELGGEEARAEAQLGGLLKSGVLKRFESCWHACLRTVNAMIAAHDAFLLGWERGEVPSGDVLRAAGAEDLGAEPLAAWVAEQLTTDADARAADEFDPGFARDVQADRDRLGAIAGELRAVDPDDDPKLAALVDLLEGLEAQKVCVFATYGATVDYLDANLPVRLAGRERVVVVGNRTTPDQRLGALGRFAPETVIRTGYEPPDGEVDLLLSTDVLSEGQNLQQAQAVVSYDMPWNPQRVVQRNGRIIRLRSPHDDVLLTTMLPLPGEFEQLVHLEARIRAKVAAAGVYGMESEVIEGDLEAELRAYADRVADGDPALLDDAEAESGAFVGEQLRRQLERAAREGELQRVAALPWGVGACFAQQGHGASVGVPGIFFAFRTPRTAAEPAGRRHWRHVPFEAESELVSTDLEMLRVIDPEGGLALAAMPLELDLEGAWRRAAQDVLATHNQRADLREDEESVGPRQRWALELLRDPGVALTAGAEEAEEALSVGRSSSVRRALGEIEADVHAGGLGLDGAAVQVVALVERFGLRRVEPPTLPTVITIDDLGVVCWMAVLPHP